MPYNEGRTHFIPLFYSIPSGLEIIVFLYVHYNSTDGTRDTNRGHTVHFIIL